jgi:hypothetical protein
MLFHGHHEKNYVFLFLQKSYARFFRNLVRVISHTKGLVFFFVCVSSFYVSIDIMRKSYARFFRNLVRVISHTKGLVFFFVCVSSLCLCVSSLYVFRSIPV